MGHVIKREKVCGQTKGVSKGVVSRTQEGWGGAGRNVGEKKKKEQTQRGGLQPIAESY